MQELEGYRAFAEATLMQAGAIAAARFRTALAIDNKLAEDANADGAGFDPVTEADRTVEAAIRARIEDRFPEHGIIGEEDSPRQATASWTWILDPIDGTRAFITGLPVWGCLLGLLRDGEPVLGFMHQPVLGETFSGDGETAWVQGRSARRRLTARKDAALADAVLASTHPDLFDAVGWARFEALGRAVRMTRYGGDCYNYCLLAHGLMDLVVEDQLSPYDILPLVPIVRGAGGLISGADGGPAQEGLVIAAANPALHLHALRAMNGG